MLKFGLDRIRSLPIKNRILHLIRWMLGAPLIIFWSIRLGALNIAILSITTRVRGWRKVNVGWMTEVDRCVILDGNIKIGKYCQINQNVVMRGDITVGDYVLIANNVTIVSGNHIYRNKSVPIRFQGSTNVPVVIESDVWICASVTICPGVKISRGSIVGANSVVTKSFPAYSVLAGSPARLIKIRS